MRLQKEIENFVKNNQVSKTVVDIDVTCRHYHSPFSTISYYSNSNWNNYGPLTGTVPVMDNAVTISSSDINSIITDSNSVLIKRNDTDNTATINKTEG